MRQFFAIILLGWLCCRSMADIEPDIRRGIDVLSLGKIAFREGNADMLQREALIRELIAIVQSPPAVAERFCEPNERRNIAIAMLGRLRATEAISDLLGRQTPIGRYRVIYGLGQSVFSPASTALYAMGDVCVIPVLQQIEKEGPVLDGYESMKVLVALKGVDGALIALEEVRKKANIEAVSSTNLDSSIALLKKNAEQFRGMRKPAVLTIGRPELDPQQNAEQTRVLGEQNESVVKRLLPQLDRQQGHIVTNNN